MTRATRLAVFAGALVVALVTRPVVGAESLRIVPGGVEFSIKAPGARHVTIAGSFDRWSTGRHELRDSDGDGVWSIVIPLPPGRHEYSFFIDGQAAFRGSRVERAFQGAFQTHVPKDMGVHWMVPVLACRISPGGGLVEGPEDPVTFALLLASSIRSVTDDVVDQEAYRRIGTLLRNALKIQPHNAWIRNLEIGQLAKLVRAKTVSELRAKVADQDAEGALLPLLQSPWVLEQERVRILDAVRRYLSGGTGGELVDETYRMAMRAVWRERLPLLEREWKAAPLDWDRIYSLKQGIGGEFSRANADEAERRFGAAMAPVLADSSGGPVEELDALSRRFNSDPQAAAEGVLNWIRVHGFPAELVACGGNLIPDEDGEKTAMWTLERLADRPELAKSYLFWELTFSARLRDQPGLEKKLEEMIRNEGDPLVGGRLTARLAYIYMLSHRESEYFALLASRLGFDPMDLELLENLRAFLGTLDNLEKQYSGLIANPWRPGLLQGLERLEAIAPDNPSLGLLLSRELERIGRRRDAEARLDRIAKRTPWDGAAASMRARMQLEDGDPAGALSVLEACWLAGSTDASLTRAFARGMASAGRVEQLQTFLEKPFATASLAAQAFAGAVEGLRERGASSATVAFLTRLAPKEAEMARLRDRALVRLYMDSIAPSGRAAEVERLLAPSGNRREDAALLVYASRAALCSGREELHVQLLRRALELDPKRRWLVEALTTPLDTEVAAAAVSLRGLPGMGPEALAVFRDAVRYPGPFARFEARASMRSATPWLAIQPLEQLERISMVPEQLRGARAGLAVAELRSGQIPWALGSLWRLAGTDADSALFLVSAGLLPFLFAAWLATGWPLERGRKSPPG